MQHSAGDLLQCANVAIRKKLVFDPQPAGQECKPSNRVGRAK